MPHSIIHGNACLAYFNKIWGIPIARVCTPRRTTIPPLAGIASCFGGALSDLSGAASDLSFICCDAPATYAPGHSRPMQPVLPAGSCPLRSESDRSPALREMTRSANQRHFSPTRQLANQVLISGLVNSASCNLTKSYMLIGLWPVSLNRSSVMRS